MRMIDQISNYTEYQIALNGDNTDLQAVLQWIRNVYACFSRMEYDNYITIDDNNKLDMKMFSMGSRIRDRQMAENILWILKHFPNEKIVVNLANYHGSKDISQTTFKDDSLFYFIHPCMAETVYKELGEKMYSIAFTALNRTNDSDEEKGNLELAIEEQTKKAPFAFLDFESLRHKDGFRDKEFDAAMIGKKRGKWQHIFDGIYYIKDEKTYQNYIYPGELYKLKLQEKKGEE